VDDDDNQYIVHYRSASEGEEMTRKAPPGARVSPTMDQRGTIAEAVAHLLEVHPGVNRLSKLLLQTGKLLGCSS
jgi:hypothetical protein